jgi:signal transduction histidine kinase
MIRGVLSMIRDGDLKRLPKEKQRQFIENAWQKGAKLDTIINDILAASELDTQKFQVDSGTPAIQLEEVVGQAVKEFALEAEERGTELMWRPPKNPLPKIRGHANFLEQALNNLVGNALKYTPSTKMAKEARSQREKKGIVEVAISQKGNNVIVKVSDNGIGIPKDEIKKLFDKFARASNATAMYTDGSGLGLFIIKEIINGHKGKVWLESELNKGSAFYISLPVVS